MNKINEKIKVLCESYEIKEDYDDNNEKKVIMEGVAITFEKPTRNRVSYTTKSGFDKHKTLIGKPFLDSHIDKSINTHPPFGHVIECWTGTNPKNGLPCLFYKVDIDPKKEDFIRQVKRGDISGTSIQVLVDSIVEKQDMYGDYIQANIREFLELSAVLIPGDGDTTMRLVESFNSYKSTMTEDLDTSNGNAVFNVDGVLPKRKVIRKDPETEEEQCKSKSKIYQPNPETDSQDEIDDIGENQNKKLIGKKMEEGKTETSKIEERFAKIESMLEKFSESMSKPEKEEKKDEEKEVDTMKSMESLIRKVLKEELKGVPERETSHKKKDIGPEDTEEVPMTTQPANGEAPSGGSIYGDDKMGKTGEDSTKGVQKPKSDYNKGTVQKNSLDEARTLIEKAKSIMKEYAKGEDVNAPQPGRTDDEPEEMKDTKPNKGNSGFAEKVDKKNSVEKMYESLLNEIKTESSRKSTISMPISENLNGNTVQNSIKEYLNKSNLNTIIYNK